jgi:hypothetical protein
VKDFYTEPNGWLKNLRYYRPSLRQMRSEGRERTAAVMGLLLHYTDLATMTVSIPTPKGDQRGLDMRFMARQLGWRTEKDDRQDRELLAVGKRPRDKGVKRVWRGIHTLVRSGYVQVHRRYQFLSTGESTRVVGLGAIRSIAPQVFYDLGVSARRLKQKRSEAEKRARKRRLAARESSSSTVLGGFHPVHALIQDAQKRAQRRAQQARATEAQAEEAERIRRLRCGELICLPENAGLSPEAFYAKYPDLARPEPVQDAVSAPRSIQSLLTSVASPDRGASVSKAAVSVTRSVPPVVSAPGFCSPSSSPTPRVDAPSDRTDCGPQEKENKVTLMSQGKQLLYQTLRYSSRNRDLSEEAFRALHPYLIPPDSS